MAKDRLEKAANLAIILTCAFFSAYLGIRVYRSLGSRAVSAPPAYKAGDFIMDSPELGLKNSPLNLLIVTKSTCPFCTASMPFYQRAVEAARKAGTRTIGMSSEDPSVNRAYLLANAVQVESVASTANNGLKPVPTPTLILVGSDGKVINSWVGQLAAEREAEVLKAVVHLERRGG